MVRARPVVNLVRMFIAVTASFCMAVSVLLFFLVTTFSMPASRPRANGGVGGLNSLAKVMNGRLPVRVASCTRDSATDCGRRGALRLPRRLLSLDAWNSWVNGHLIEAWRRDW